MGQRICKVCLLGGWPSERWKDLPLETFDATFPDLSPGGPLAGMSLMMLADGGIIRIPLQDGLDLPLRRSLWRCTSTTGNTGGFRPP